MYHERFNNLHPSAVQAVDDLCPRVWNTDDESALEMFRMFADDLAGVYDIPTPRVRYGDYEAYFPVENLITIPHPSVVSFLHEFRHHMQHHGQQANPDIEEDARGWSISMFAEAEPEYFETAWQDGRIWFMPDYEEVEA